VLYVLLLLCNHADPNGVVALLLEILCVVCIVVVM